MSRSFSDLDDFAVVVGRGIKVVNKSMVTMLNAKVNEGNVGLKDPNKFASPAFTRTLHMTQKWSDKN